MHNLQALLFLLLIGTWIQATSAATFTFFLDASAATDGDGSQASPFQLGDSAVAAVNDVYLTDNSNSVVLNVAPGEYTVTLTLETSGPAANFDLNGPTNGEEAVITFNGIFMFINYTCAGGSYFNMNNVTIQHCRTQSHSTALLIYQCASSLIDHVTFRNCSGAFPQTIELDTNCTITNCRFESGIVSTYIRARGITPGDHLDISNTVFEDASDTGSGGYYGLIDVQFDVGSGTFTMTDCQITNNYNAGSILMIQDTPTTLTRCLFRSNLGDSMINSTNSFVSLVDSQVILNPNASYGALVSRFGASLIYLTRTSVWQNSRDWMCVGGGNISTSAGVVFCNLNCPTGRIMDRCNVCNGTNTCVGCDNVPFSTATCDPVVTPTAGGTPKTTQTSWTGNSPSPTLLDKDNEAGDTATLKLNIESLKVVTPGGANLDRWDLDTLPWFIEPAIGDNYYGRVFTYYAPGPNKPIFTLEEIFYYSAANLTSGDVTFGIDELQMKLSLSIKDWKANASNLLVFSVSVTSDSPLTALDTNTTQYGGYDFESVSITTLGSQLSVAFPYWADINGITQGIRANKTVVNSYTTRYEFIFPAGFSYMTYDPNFGVLVTVQADDDDDNLGLIIGLSVGLPIAFLTVVAVIVIGSVLLWFNRRRVRGLYSNPSLASVDGEDIN